MQPSTTARRVLSALIGATVAVSTAIAVLPAQADDGTQTSVAGQVTLDGKPTGGLTVCAGGAIYSPVQGYQNHSACTTTDADGSYSVAFNFPGSSDMASVWVDPGAEYQHVFASTAVNQVRDLGGYISLAQGDQLTGMDIAVSSFPRPFSVSAPTITGTARVGKKLTAAVAVTGADSAKLSYRWYRNGHKIAGATKKAYRLTTQDRNKKVTVKVTVRADRQAPVTATSAPTAKIARR